MSIEKIIMDESRIINKIKILYYYHASRIGKYSLSINSIEFEYKKLINDLGEIISDYGEVDEH